MEIGILHLTDIHFNETTNLNDKLDSLCKAVLYDFSGIKNVYIIISGDIADSGLVKEYGTPHSLDH